MNLPDQIYQLAQAQHRQNTKQKLCLKNWLIDKSVIIHCIWILMCIAFSYFDQNKYVEMFQTPNSMIW